MVSLFGVAYIAHLLHYVRVQFAHNPVAYEAEEWSRPDEIALFHILWNHTRRQLDTRPNCRLLDACCGSGLSLLGSVSHPHLFMAVGVDLSSPLLDFARRRYEPFGNVVFLRGDAAQQMFAASSFDLIIACSAYHHIEHVRKIAFLKTCRTLLKDDGCLLVAENVLPPYKDGGSAYDQAIQRLYAAVKCAALAEYPDLPTALHNMIDENVILSLRRQYEFKVDHRRILRDFRDSQFALECQIKAWPSGEGALDRSAGNFLFILKKSSGEAP